LPSDIFERLRGKFVVLDGVDGAGKGAQLDLLHKGLENHGVEVVQTRDPGGTIIGDRIRHVLLDYDLSRMDVHCETFLFMASRAQLASEVIRPALAEKKTCLGDRYVSATCAYQGAAGYDPKRVIDLARMAIGDNWPHLTIIIDMPPEHAFERTSRKTQAERKKEQRYRNRNLEGHPTLFHDVHTDAMEARPLEFHQRVREIFLDLPSFYPAPVTIVDGTGSVEDVQQYVMEAISRAAL
jgi:dTMP kinase